MSRPFLPHRSRDSTGRVPTMKGCLKSPMPSPGLDSCHARKTVAFGDEVCEEVYFADVWDRTPTEPARKLTYQDLLELKEIQRSLPRANQLADPISGRPASEYLSDVPIGLLPLLSETSSSPNSSSPTSPTFSPPSTPLALTGLSVQAWPLPPPPRPRQPPVVSKPWAPPHLAHLLPKNPPPVRQKPTFAFLPLLETPPSSEASSPYTSHPSSRSPSPDRDSHHQYHSDTDDTDTTHDHDPPTPSLTNASLDSSPLSRASSASPEPSCFRLGPSLKYREGYSSDHDDNFPSISSLKLGRGPRPFSPQPLSPTTAWHAYNSDCSTNYKKRHPSVSPQRSDTSTSSSSEYNAPRRRRNVMILNGIEIDLDDEDEDDGYGGSTPGGSCSTYSPSELLRPPIPLPMPLSVSPPAIRTPTRSSPSSSPSSSPKLTWSPTSSPSRRTKALPSARFQRDKVGAQVRKMGHHGNASP